MITAADIVSALRNHADQGLYSLGCYIDDDDLKQVVIDGWVDLEAVAAELNEKVKR